MGLKEACQGDGKVEKERGINNDEERSSTTKRNKIREERMGRELRRVEESEQKKKIER